MRKTLSFMAILIFGAIFNTFCANQQEIDDKADEAYKYCEQAGLSTDFCILIDMSIHSGKYRMFVYDFERDSVIIEGLCSHGCGDSNWGSDATKTKPKFSNVSESHCSSLGKYRIGNRGYSNWGINVNYKLHGLEKTNSNAYKRLIVFHSWNMVPDKELYPKGTPEGWGCPAISDDNMKAIDKLLKRIKTPVLMWIYE
jgi:hypothetical protein